MSHAGFIASWESVKRGRMSERLVGGETMSESGEVEGEDNLWLERVSVDVAELSGREICFRKRKWKGMSWWKLRLETIRVKGEYSRMS